MKCKIHLNYTKSAAYVLNIIHIKNKIFQCPLSLQALLHACKCLKAPQKGWLLSGAELICGTVHAFGSHW